ncbi:MAG: oxidoreductase [Actinomycetota bacterium]|nr:oxidoreductase [Actinomycetota bacterium]
MDQPVAIVTGGSSGIGESVCQALQGAGFMVYAAARRTEQMAGLAAAGMKVVKVDVTDDGSLVALVDQVVAETGRIDVLVNNAGYGSYGALEDVPMDEARRQFDVNVFALARLTQLVLPHMRSRRSGRIVNISSMGGKIYEPMGSWYHSTKFAVEGLSDSLRMELRPFGIQVVVIEPGAIKTEWAGISADNVRARSAGGPYAQQAGQVGAVLDAGAGETARGSDPRVVADAVVKAATARRPRTRYAIGLGAKPLILLRRVLPDRGFDFLMRQVFRRADRG